MGPVEITTSQLPQFISVISNKPHTAVLQARCAVQIVATPTHAVFTDNRDNPIIVLLVSLQTIRSMYREDHYLYIDDNAGQGVVDDSKLATFLDHFELGDTSRSLYFRFINFPVADAIVRYMHRHGIDADAPLASRTNVYQFDSRIPLDLPLLDKSLKVDSLAAGDADKVASTWDMYICADKIEFVRFSIEHYPSVCIRDTSRDGQLASFIIATPYGLQNHIFTYPDYRKKNLGKFVALAHAKKLVPVFGVVLATPLTTNIGSIMIHEKSDSFTRLNFGTTKCVTGIHANTNSTSQARIDVLRLRSKL